MPPIDPSIALGFKMPQIQDPVAATARAQEVGVNALKMGEMQRGIASQNKLRELYSQGVDVSTPEGFKQLAAVDPSAAMKLRNDALQSQKLQGEIKETGLKITAKQMDAFRERIGSLEFNPSNANIQARLEDSVLQGEITPQEAQQRFAEATAVPLNQRPSYFRNMGVKTEERYKMNTISAAQQQTADIQKGQLDVSRGNLNLAQQGQKLQYDTDLQGRIAEAKAAGEFVGKNRAAAAAALPGAVEAANEGVRLINEMVGVAEVKDKSGKVITKGTAPHPGFKDYVGGTLRPGMRFLEGSDAASFEVRQKQIEGKAFLEAFQALKGGGAITEKEGEKGTAAIMRMNKASNEKEYVAAARELQGVLRTGLERARTKAGETPTTPSATPSGGGGVIDFNTLK
jgi:hypothetical protein